VASGKPQLLDLAAGDAVAQIANVHLRHAAKALARLRNPADRTALHNFRVAIRRLRSLLRAYRPWIGRAAGKKIQRRLRTLTRTTGFSRDAEVQIAWLEGKRRDLDRRERIGLNGLLRRLRTRKREYDRVARRQLAREFERTAKLLRKRLARQRESDSVQFREAFNQLLAKRVARFSRRLAAVANADDQRLAHAARVETKRLRYLVEPLRGALPEARAAAREAKRLQDLLGRLNDRHLLESTLRIALEAAGTERSRRLLALTIAHDQEALAREHRSDEQPGLLELAVRARAERDALFGKLDRQWIRKRGPELAILLGKLRAVSLPGDAIEIERKYLLRSLPPGAQSAPAEDIEQGWLPGERLRERLRRVRRDGGERFFRTVKLGAGIQRTELEEETTAEVFEALWPLTAGCRVLKRRYRVEEGALAWEIDQFLGRDLVLAEIELPDPATPVELPAWLERFVVREVTGDPSYLNLHLAR
jgi:CHAD domain-containing protein/CYTH domain-containing protein